MSREAVDCLGESLSNMVFYGRQQARQELRALDRILGGECSDYDTRRGLVDAKYDSGDSQKQCIVIFYL